MSIQHDYRDLVLKTFIEISLPKAEDFLVVKETLTRIGVAVTREDSQTLYQRAHILHKKGRYFIVHYKQMYLLDGHLNDTVFAEEDQLAVNTIASMLEAWGLVRVVHPSRFAETLKPMTLMVLTFDQKPNWKLVPKYTIGKYRHKKGTAHAAQG